MTPTGGRRQSSKAALSHFRFWMLFYTLERLPQSPKNKNQPCLLTSSLDTEFCIYGLVGGPVPGYGKLPVMSLGPTVLLNVARTNIFECSLCTSLNAFSY